MADIDPLDLGKRDAYRFLVSTVIPRPIAWVSTVSRDGVGNLAPYSFFNAFAAKPTILAIGVNHRRKPDTPPGSEDPAHLEPKDTLANVRDTGEFTVSLVTDRLGEAMNVTAAEYPADVDEFDAAKLARAPSTRVKPPRVADSPIAWECVLYDIVEFRRSKARPDVEIGNFTTMILGEVVNVHVDDAVLDPETGRPDIAKVGPLARLGGADYWRNGETFTLPRPPRPER